MIVVFILFVIVAALLVKLIEQEKEFLHSLLDEYKKKK